MAALDEIHKLFAGAAASQLNTLDGQWKQFKKNVDDVALSIGDALKPIATSVLKAMNDAFNPSQIDAANRAIKITKEQIAVLDDQLKSGAIQQLQYDIEKKDLLKDLANETKSLTKATADQNAEHGKTPPIIEAITYSTGAMEDEMYKALDAYKALTQAARDSLNFTQTGIGLFNSLGVAIGATAAGSTTAWKDFAKNSLDAVLQFAEKAIEAQMAVDLASGNIPGVALGAAGLIAVSGIQGYIDQSVSSSASSSSSSSSSSPASSSDPATAAPSGATTVANSGGTNLSINLYNPTFWDLSSQIAAVNNLLNLAVANGWNITRTPSVQMAP